MLKYRISSDQAQIDMFEVLELIWKMNYLVAASFSSGDADGPRATDNRRNTIHGIAHKTFVKTKHANCIDYHWLCACRHKSRHWCSALGAAWVLFINKSLINVLFPGIHHITLGDAFSWLGKGTVRCFCGLPAQIWQLCNKADWNVPTSNADLFFCGGGCKGQHFRKVSYGTFGSKICFLICTVKGEHRLTD